MDAPKLFAIGDVVWAQLTLYTLKPCKIVQQMDNKIDVCESSYYVYFFGSHEYQWVQESLLSHHSEELLEDAESWTDLDQETLKELKRELMKPEEQKYHLDFESVSSFNPDESYSGEECSLSPVQCFESILRQEPDSRKLPLEESPLFSSPLKREPIERQGKIQKLSNLMQNDHLAHTSTKSSAFVIESTSAPELDTLKLPLEKSPIVSRSLGWTIRRKGKKPKLSNFSKQNEFVSHPPTKSSAFVIESTSAPEPDTLKLPLEEFPLVSTPLEQEPIGKQGKIQKLSNLMKNDHLAQPSTKSSALVIKVTSGQEPESQKLPLEESPLIRESAPLGLEPIIRQGKKRKLSNSSKETEYLPHPPTKSSAFVIESTSAPEFDTLKLPLKESPHISKFIPLGQEPIRKQGKESNSIQNYYIADPSTNSSTFLIETESPMKSSYSYLNSLPSTSFYVPDNMSDSASNDSNNFKQPFINQAANSYLASNIMLTIDDPSKVPETLPQKIFSSPPIQSENSENVFDNTASTSWANPNVCDFEVLTYSTFHNNPEPTTSLLDVAKSGAMPNNIQINANELSNNDCISTSSINSTLTEKPAFLFSDIPEQFDAQSIGKDSEMSSVDSTDEDSNACLIDNQTISDILDNSSKRIDNAPEYIRPTDKKIGFLGCGEIGHVIIQNFLNSGHYITLWNRTPEKYKCFLNDGAEKAGSPSDVVMKCDIVFCCLSDANAVRKVFDGKKGVLEGLAKCQNKTKSFVQLTSLGPYVAGELSKKITKKGGKYLGAHILGSKELAQELSLMFICAGDAQLFHDCTTCFASTSSNAIYVGCNVQRASKMKLVLSMITGAMNIGLHEALSLVSFNRLSLDTFINVILKGYFSCPAMVNKAIALVNNKNMETVTGIESNQRDLFLVTLLSERIGVSMPLAASLHQVYLHAKKSRK